MFLKNNFLTVRPQIFGGNMDIKTERRHYLNVPMVTRYVRLHPLTWRKRIGLRAGAIGCHHSGEDCGPGFLRVNTKAGCGELIMKINMLFIFFFSPEQSVPGLHLGE